MATAAESISNMRELAWEILMNEQDALGHAASLARMGALVQMGIRDFHEAPNGDHCGAPRRHHINIVRHELSY
jgi:hypothetical protein